jgi:4-hydroxybenzoyl-CoA thioesterase
MIAYARPIRFDEVDAARLVFFGRYPQYAHEAMELLFASLEGGYSRLILERGIGLPAVDVKMRFTAPVRYGDALIIETRAKHLGTRSAVLEYVMKRKSDGVVAAELDHTIVVTDLVAMKSTDMPADVRAVLQTHLVTS